MIELIIKLFTDPKIFNYLLLVINVLAAIRWLIEGSFWNAVYFASAFTLTLAVTQGLKN